MSEHSSPTELTAILADHKLWLYANGGKRANLYGADLRDADLRDADLRRADLTNTCVVLLLDDDGRYYQVVAHAGLTSDGEALYLAGCRQLTITGARKHWTDPDHTNPEAAARILAAVEAHHTAWENAR